MDRCSNRDLTLSDRNRAESESAICDVLDLSDGYGCPVASRMLEALAYALFDCADEPDRPNNRADERQCEVIYWNFRANPRRR